MGFLIGDDTRCGAGSSPRLSWVLLVTALITCSCRHAPSQESGKPTADVHVSDFPASCPAVSSQAVVQPFRGQPEKNGLLPASAWGGPVTASFCADWRGQHTDAERQTDVRVLWSNDALYLRFDARYRELNLYPTRNQRQEKLYLRDVAEVFLQPAGSSKEQYKEIEISANGDWLALDIISMATNNTPELKCDIKTMGEIDEARRVWTAEVAIPMNCLTARFSPAAPWRVNFFRIEGPMEDGVENTALHRFYSAWQPTRTKRPFFHVPEVFGKLKFAFQ
jgi:Carbohydrate family 9 binding domain-like